MKSHRYRKRPVVVEAVLYAPGKVPLDDIPEWYVEACFEHRIVPVENGDDLLISTLEGVMTARRGDWIIRGVQGELYPIKNDIFEATYEPAEPTP